MSGWSATSTSSWRTSCRIRWESRFSPRAMLGAGNRIEDRRTFRLDHAVDLGLGGAAVDVDLEIDVGDDRLMDLVAGRDEDVKYRGSGLGVLASQDAEQGRLLLGRRAAV